MAKEEGKISLEALDAAFKALGSIETTSREVMRRAMRDRVKDACSSRTPQNRHYIGTLMQELFDRLCACVPRRRDMHAIFLGKLEATRFVEQLVAPADKPCATQTAAVAFCMFVTQHLREIEDVAGTDHTESERVATALVPLLGGKDGEGEEKDGSFDLPATVSGLLHHTHAWLDDFDRRLSAARHGTSEV